MSKKIFAVILQTTDTLLELFVIYLVILFGAASLYMLFEHKAFFDSLWWAVVTAMTVGYGDTYPLTIGGRIIAIILMHIVPLALIPLITARLSSKLIVDSDAFTNEEQEEIKAGIRRINKWINLQPRRGVK